VGVLQNWGFKGAAVRVRLWENGSKGNSGLGPRCLLGSSSNYRAAIRGGALATFQKFKQGEGTRGSTNKTSLGGDAQRRILQKGWSS